MNKTEKRNGKVDEVENRIKRNVQTRRRRRKRRRITAKNKAKDEKENVARNGINEQCAK